MTDTLRQDPRQQVDRPSSRLIRWPVAIRALTVPALLLAITIGVFWKIVLTDQYNWLNSPDLTYQVVPWLQFQAAQWKSGHVPLWDPYLTAGQSLIGQVQPGVVNPLNWLLFWAPLRDGYLRLSSLNWYFVLIHYLAALFFYWLARDLDRSRMAALLGACGFAFGGYVGSTDWPQYLNSAIWAPLVLLFSLRALRGRRPILNSFISGTFLGISYLSGHHQVPIFVTLAVCGLWIFHAIDHHRHAPLRISLAFAVFLAATFAGGAGQILPGYSYGKTSVRWVGADHPLEWHERVPYSVHEQFNLSPSSVIGVVVPGVFTNSNPYVGLTILVLALTAIVLSWRSIAVRIFTGLSLFGLLLAMSSFTLLHGVFYAAVPMVEKARNPSTAAFLFTLGLCALASFGLDALSEETAFYRSWLSRVIWAAVIFSFFLWALLTIIAFVKSPVTNNPEHLAKSALAACFLSGILAGWRAKALGSATASTLLLLLALMEVGSLPGMNLTPGPAGQAIWNLLRRDADVAAFLKAQPGVFRVDLNGTDVPYNFGDWYGIETLTGYVASIPIRTVRILYDNRATALLGLKYIVAKTPPRDGLREVFTSRSELKVFEVPDAYPRVWTVHQAARLRSEAEITSTLDDPAGDLRHRTFLLEPAPALEQCEGDQVELGGRNINRVRIEAEMRCRGIVILADTYAEGWTATVDGRPAPVLAAYSFLRGVAVDAGKHRIELRYAPRLVYAGAAITACSLIGLVIVLARRIPPEAMAGR